MIYIYLLLSVWIIFILFFFFNDTATTEIYTLSLHDALPILDVRHVVEHDARDRLRAQVGDRVGLGEVLELGVLGLQRDRKSTRLNSSHSQISYAVFCLKKKNKDIYSCVCSRTYSSESTYTFI